MEALVEIEAESFRVAKSLYALRRRRDCAMQINGLFGEPAWDILLDLYIAHMSRADLQVSSVCIDAGVPSTTILRWIARLEREGLVYRAADCGDARRRFVRLTEGGHVTMSRVLSIIAAGL